MKKQNQISDSIFKKRLKRFKSIKRGYYSLIILIIAYIFSLFATIFVNSTALMIRYTNNNYDLGEEFIDESISAIRSTPASSMTLHGHNFFVEVTT